MTQSDGKNNLQRMAIGTNDGNGNINMYYFRINPQNYTETYPQRTATYKTRTNAIIEDYGADLPLINFSGTTGFRKDSKGKNGAQRLFDLQKFITKYAEDNHSEGSNKTEMTFYNFTDNKSFIVHLGNEGFSITRDANSPLLYTYSISLVVLRKAGTPEGSVPPSIGNNYGGGNNTAGEGINQGAVNPNGNENVYEGAMDNIKDHLGTSDDKSNSANGSGGPTFNSGFNGNNNGLGFGGSVGTRPSGSTNGMGREEQGGTR